jgi:hypothetical protein
MTCKTPSNIRVPVIVCQIKEGNRLNHNPRQAGMPNTAFIIQNLRGVCGLPQPSAEWLGLSGNRSLSFFAEAQPKQNS